MVDDVRKCPLIKTLAEDARPRYSLANGADVSQTLAMQAIADKRVVPVDSGLIDNPQQWPAV